MKKIIISCAFVLAAAVCALGQKPSQFKEVPASEVQSTDAYINGNKYEKDAILFIDMLGSTHPYYVRADRRAVLDARLDDLVAKCECCTDDKEFAQLLRDAMPEVCDKHTDVMDLESFMSRKTQKQSATAENPVAGSDCPLERSSSLFNYRILKKESICYLQFNQCNDARTLKDESLPRFDEMLTEMFTAMRKKHIGTLIVDVQYNNGGSSRLCDELIDRIYPYSKVKGMDTYMRFSPLLAEYSPKTTGAMKAWNEAGNSGKLYPIPEKKVQVPEHEVFEGKVVFIQGSRTFSSAGILLTTARDNGIGTIVGVESTYSPSHYGEVLPFKLPNTGVVGSVCTKYIERADKSCAEDKTLKPDTFIDLSDKEEAWGTILGMFAKKR